MRVAPIDLSIDLIQQSVTKAAVSLEASACLRAKHYKASGSDRVWEHCGIGDDDTYPKELCTSNDMKRVSGSMVRIYLNWLQRTAFMTS